MNIELHADDLGATEGVNKNILTAWRAGCIDGASVIANGDALLQAARVLRSNQEKSLRLAVHLNLSEGVALENNVHNGMLTDNGGRFIHGFLSLWRFWISLSRSKRALLLDQIYLEWKKQILTVREAIVPRKISALDGHVHIHMLPFLVPLVFRLAEEFSIPEIRTPNEIFFISLSESFGYGYLLNLVKFSILKILSRSAQNIIRDSNLSGPDAVTGILYSGRMSYSTIMKAAKAAQRRSIDWLEVICHPGRARESEADRWVGQTWIRDFYRDLRRDYEYKALIKIGRERFDT